MNISFLPPETGRHDGHHLPPGDQGQGAHLHRDTVKYREASLIHVSGYNVGSGSSFQLRPDPGFIKKVRPGLNIEIQNSFKSNFSFRIYELY